MSLSRAEAARTRGPGAAAETVRSRARPGIRGDTGDIPPHSGMTGSAAAAGDKNLSVLDEMDLRFELSAYAIDVIALDIHIHCTTALTILH